MNRVLLVGSESSVAQIALELGRIKHAGYRVVGACVPSGRVADSVPGTDIPVMGNVDSVERAMLATDARQTREVDPDRVRDHHERPRLSGGIRKRVNQTLSIPDWSRDRAK